MFAVALAITVASSCGGLLSEGHASRGARLIESPLTFVGGGLTGATPFDHMTLPELEHARAGELANRHSVAGPVVMITLGVVAALVGVIMTAGAAFGSQALLIAGLIVFFSGGGLLGAGIGVLVAVIVRNAKVKKHVHTIDKRIALLRYGPKKHRGAPLSQPPPEYDATPPAMPDDFQQYPEAPPQQLSPPPLPPEQGIRPVPPSFVVASF